MSKQELLEEIQKLPIQEQRELLDELRDNVSHREKPASEPMSEDEIERLLMERGVLNRTPSGFGERQDEEEFEPIVVQGKPLSQTIIEERLRIGASSVVLVSADGELNAAAVTAGLRVEDPNTHP